MISDRQVFPLPPRRGMHGARVVLSVAALLLIPLAGVWAGHAHALSFQPPTPTVVPTPPPPERQMPGIQPAAGQVHLPALEVLGGEPGCKEIFLHVQNMGNEPTKTILIVWGDPSPCPPQCAGPLKIECSGLMKPGSRWSFNPNQIPSGSRSGALYSFTARTLREIGVELGFDDAVADLMCETLFYGVTGDCDDYRRFRKAYEDGSTFAGIPLNRAWGEPLAVEVARTCLGGTADAQVQVHSSYNAVPGTDLGTWDPVLGGYGYMLPALHADPAGPRSYVNVQNAGWECAEVEVWFRRQDTCAPAATCAVFTMPPGESQVVDVTTCPGAGGLGAGWVRSSQRLAVAVDTVTGGTLMSYAAAPADLSFGGYETDPDLTPGSDVLYPPLVYGDLEGWSTRIHIQNQSAETEAEAKLYLLDRSGDVITTLVQRICPRGSYTFDLSRFNGVPGGWVGAVRVESREWWLPGDPPDFPPYLAGVVEFVQEDGGSVGEAAAYRMLTEHDAFDWAYGAGSGGTESGAGLIALPNLRKDSDATGATAAFAVANLVAKPGFTDYAVFIYDQNGLFDYVCEKLNEKQVEYIDLQTWGYINPGFKGSAVVSAVFWEHDLYDQQGSFVRNLLGLGAAVLTRPAATDAQPHPLSVVDGPGDSSAASAGIAVKAGPFDAAFAPCPGLTPPPPRTPVTPTRWPPWTPGTPTSTPVDGTGTPTPAPSPTDVEWTATPPRLPHTIWLPVAGNGWTSRHTTPDPTPTRTPETTPTPRPTSAPTGEVPPGPYVGPAPEVFVPVLNFRGDADLCASRIAVQNVGSEPSKAMLITWGEPGFCPPQCAGPLKVECSGLIRPGASWSFLGAQVPTGSMSGVLYSFTARTLRQIGVELGFDDVVADVMCETLFFGVVGDCDDYRRFKRAYDEGDKFAGIPQDKARGAPLVVEILRKCPGNVDSAVVTTASYAGVPATDLGAYDPVERSYLYHVPLVYRGNSGFDSVLYIQNAGLECASVEIWFKAQDDCLETQLCKTITIAPGETYSFRGSDCGAGFKSGALLRGSGPLAVASDIVGRDVLSTFNAVPDAVVDATDGTVHGSGSMTLFAPVFFSEYQGWDTVVQVFNRSPLTAAKAKVYFLDRGGDVITTLTDWICQRGSQSFFLPLVDNMPGNWVGSVRVVSQEWWTPGGPMVTPPLLSGVAWLNKWGNPSRLELRESAAYNLLTEAGGFDWMTGHGDGGLSSGAGLIAVPYVTRRNPNDVRSELAITNLVPKPGYTDFATLLVDRNGRVETLCQRQWEKVVQYVDMTQWDHLAPDFIGSAIISAGAWNHPLDDDEDNLVRNLVGLSAAVVQRTGTELGQDLPGDELAVSLGVPLRGEVAADLLTSIEDTKCPDPAVRPPRLRPAAAGRAAHGQVHIPLLNLQQGAAVCQSEITVQNLGAEPENVLLVVWGRQSGCGDTCAGPIAVGRTDQIEPGGSWSIWRTDLPDDAQSVVAYSFDESMTEQATETLRQALVGRCDAYADFQQAYRTGGVFADLHMLDAVGGPLAVEALRHCPGAADSELPTTSAYRGVTGAELGALEPNPDPDVRFYRYSLPLLHADADPFTSAVHVQNAGADCATVELWFTAGDDCSAEPRLCRTASIPPGESAQLDVLGCAEEGAPATGAGWLTSEAPLAVAVDLIGRREGGDALMTYTGRPWWVDDPEGGAMVYGSPVAFGPLIYNEYQGWQSAVSVQNLHPNQQAKVQAVFMDRSGDIIATLTDWVCPRGSQTIVLPMVDSIPGNWIGSVRVESLAYTDAAGQWVAPPHVNAVATLIRHPGPEQPEKVTEAVAYNLLPEGESFDWGDGRGEGGGTSGATVIALTNLRKADPDAIGPESVSTEIAIANLVPQAGFTDFAVLIFDQNGLVDYVCEKLNERQVEYINVLNWGYVAPDFQGGVVVSALYWDHGLRLADGLGRNLVGLGAVFIQRSGTALGRSTPGDEAAASAGLPLTPALASEFVSALPLSPRVMCPRRPPP